MLSRLAIFSFLIFNGHLFAQTTDSVPAIRILDINPRYVLHNDSLWVQSGICKVLKVAGYTKGTYGLSGIGQEKRFLRITGNVQYDFLYRSFADTPFYQKDFRQHTLRTSLTIYTAQKYPLHVNLVIRKSNSPYFRDFFDGSFRFDKYSYLQNVKRELLQKISAKIPELSYLDEIKKLLEKQIQQYNILKNKLASRSLAQELIEERERIYFRQLQQPRTNIPGSGVPDSLKSELEELVGEKRKELDSLKNKIETLQAKADSVQHSLNNRLANIRKEINKAKSPRDFTGILSRHGMEEEKSKWEKFVAGVRNIGIGRSVLDYSELTAKNVSLTGINLEYNPKMYFAIAAGKVDYGFRDFFGKNSNRSMGQYLLMGRVGWGDPEKKAIIFSAFTGRKANYGAVLSDTVSGSILVTGYAVELILRKDEKTSFRIEAAKSTRPFSGSFADNKELNSLFSFSDNTNFGVSLNGQTELAATGTRLNGMFRKSGRNFQSFSLFTYNTDQTAWMLKAEQPFFKEKVFIEGAVRRNDFVNPFTEKTFKTTTVFGSARLSIRFPKWPVLNAGYYPGSQLYIIDRDRIRENLYYILNGSLLHQYKIAGTRMVSSVIYNSYTAKGTDSGFINYSGKNYMLSQSVYFRNLQLQGSGSYTDQEALRFCTLDANADYAFKQSVRIGAGIKYNKIINGNTYWGGTGQLIIDFKILGSLQLQYEKSFLPTIQQNLFPVEMGRLTWFKNF